MKYKMVVSDFDDTLLRSDHTISKSTVDAIKQYRDAGGIFTISTGRHIGSLFDQLPRLGLSAINIPLMSMNGGFIIESLTKKVLRKVAIEKATLISAAKVCEESGWYFHIYDEDSAYVAEENDVSRQYQEITGTLIKSVGKLSEFITESGREFIKLMIFEHPEKIEDVKDALSAKYPEVQLFTSTKFLLEMVSRDSGKGSGLEYVARLEGIDLGEIMAVGDSMNDFSLLEKAGLGVAVENADTRLKGIADFITLSSDEDGVAYAIRKFCF